MNRDAVAQAMWQAELKDAGVSHRAVDARTLAAFAEEGETTRAKWHKLADAAISAMGSGVKPLIDALGQIEEATATPDGLTPDECIKVNQVAHGALSALTPAPVISIEEAAKFLHDHLFPNRDTNPELDKKVEKWWKRGYSHGDLIRETLRDLSLPTPPQEEGV